MLFLKKAFEIFLNNGLLVVIEDSLLPNFQGWPKSPFFSMRIEKLQA